MAQACSKRPGRITFSFLESDCFYLTEAKSNKNVFIFRHRRIYSLEICELKPRWLGQRSEYMNIHTKKKVANAKPRYMQLLKGEMLSRKTYDVKYDVSILVTSRDNRFTTWRCKQVHLWSGYTWDITRSDLASHGVIRCQQTSGDTIGHQDVSRYCHVFTISRIRIAFTHRVRFSVARVRDTLLIRVCSRSQQSHTLTRTHRRTYKHLTSLCVRPSVRLSVCLF